jgi:hypothetical protein
MPIPAARRPGAVTVTAPVPVPDGLIPSQHRALAPILAAAPPGAATAAGTAAALSPIPSAVSAAGTAAALMPTLAARAAQR